MAITNVTWIEGMDYIGTDAAGRSIKISGDSDGEGASPMQLLLIGLGSCSSVDVVNILKKQRLELKELKVNVEGHRGEEPPRPYNKIHMEFLLWGAGISSEKVKRAIQLSTEKYCGVHGTLRGIAEITWDFKVFESND